MVPVQVVYTLFRFEQKEIFYSFSKKWPNNAMIADTRDFFDQFLADFDDFLKTDF